MSDRPLRSCDVCGQIDDHPRHIFDTNAAENFAVNEDAIKAAFGANEDGKVSGMELYAIVTDLRDTSFLTRHFDCCRDAGCPTGECGAVLESVDNAHGLAIVKALNPGEKV